MKETTPVDYQRTQAFLLAWLCLKDDYFDGATMLSKAKWLMSMGFTRSDAASALGSTDESLRVMLSTESRRAAPSS